MAITKHVGGDALTYDEFVQEFINAGRGKFFSEDGFEALFDFLDDGLYELNVHALTEFWTELDINGVIQYYSHLMFDVEDCNDLDDWVPVLSEHGEVLNADDTLLVNVM